MKVGIHQPQYMPWPGYFAKILSCDLFILFDTAQYVKNSIINRNKILINGTESYLTIPVSKGKLNETIDEKRIVDFRWKNKQRKTIDANYANHPYYFELKTIFDDVLNTDSNNLCDYNINSIRAVCEYLNIKTRIKCASDYDIINNGDPTEFIINIVKHVEGTRYVSGTGAINYLDTKLVNDSGLEFNFYQFKSIRYNQKGTDSFIPGLSMIDLIANLPSADIRDYLIHNWELI
jgi:hypothetical protein